ncbi:MAG: hypothetical protein UT32_C0003G0003 [Parcubacteria group bacterium GW2011_GWC2_39_14]|nr:MAG: hypothetical protein UT32_C0003G0003 [Parcubacteria group bacterium GW2011_GWC2_39_14]KKR54952.1 MAG: hypothetical protein UT91_C0006G0003 [Parcubacteria group bacterium GW2011_GWA2_40_23]
MENVRPINHLKILTREWRKILIVALIVVFVSLVYSLVQPFLYRATVSILVLQKSSFSIDAYSASKSEERIANKLAQVVYSSSFMKNVVTSGYYINESYFPTDEYQRRKKWSETVEASVPTGLSKLTFSIYHTDPNQALQIAQAIAYTITSDKKEYIGIEDVDLKVLDTPLVSKYPVRPNILVNILLGIVLGIIFGIAYVVLSYDSQKDKLFAIPRRTDIQPHLVNTNKISETASVEKAMERMAQIPEIKELEEVPELEKAEHQAEVQEENKEEVAEMKLEVPDLNQELNRRLETPRYDISKKPEVNFDNQQPAKKEYPEFSDEDKFVGMK